MFFCDLQASPALTGLSELQEYCGVLLSYVFDSMQLRFLLAAVLSTRERQPACIRKHLMPYATACREAWKPDHGPIGLD
jgi:hypothetical protein